MQTNSEDYVSGMGLGATEEAKLYAKIGKLHHEIENYKRSDRANRRN